MVVFDVFDPTSLSVAKEWFTEVELLKKDATKMLLANKYEVPPAEGAEGEKGPIPNQELIQNAKAFAKKVNVPYFEVSAKTGEGIEEAMMTLVSQAQAKMQSSATGPHNAASVNSAEDEFAAAKSSPSVGAPAKGKTPMSALDSTPIPQAARWLQGMVKQNVVPNMIGAANVIRGELKGVVSDMKSVLNGEDMMRRSVVSHMCAEHGQMPTHYCLECDRFVCPQELLDHGKGQESSESFEDADEDGFEVISAHKDLGKPKILFQNPQITFLFANFCLFFQKFLDFLA